MDSRRSKQVLRQQDGQAAVSLIAVVPAFVLVALTLAQFALAGHAALSAANAARAAARASYTGADTPAVARAARAALPPALRDGARVSASGDEAEVRLDAPRALPFLPAIPVSASAELGPDGGQGGG